MSELREDSPEQAEYRAKLKGWLKKNLPPKPKFHLPTSFLEIETKDQIEYLGAWQRSLFDAGYLGIGIPAEYGGVADSQPWTQKIVMEELSRSGAPILPNMIGLGWAMPTILMYGTDAQKKKYVKNILSCEDIWCQGFSEPGAGSDLGSAQCFAEKKGDKWVVNGHKIWTTVGHFAKYMILLARTNKEGKKHEGLSYFLMPMKVPGVEVKPLVKMTREATFNQVFIENVEMPLDALLGKEGQGWQIAMTTLLHERGAGGGGNRGFSAAIEETVRRVTDLARATRRGKSRAIDDPLVQDKLAQFAIEVEAMRQNETRLRIQSLQDWNMGLLFMGKLAGSELVMKIEEMAVDLQGPAAGQWMDSPSAVARGIWQLGHMNGYGPIIGGGTSEIQKNILGERILGLAKG